MKKALFFVILCFLMSAAMSQTQNGVVTVTADDDVICYGESTTLHAYASTVIDFETGDFSQAEFDNTGSDYPWEITTSNPHGGTYCMKSTGEGEDYADSYITLTLDVPYDGYLGFWVKTSSESNYDKFHFYVDNVDHGGYSGNKPYQYLEYYVTAGTHTYKWQYKKDVNINHYDDCIYVDDISLFYESQSVHSYLYGFYNDLEGWTNIDADGDWYGWGWFSTPDHSGNDGGCASSASYLNYLGPLYPDNYLVSPSKVLIHNGAYISFWACAQDITAPADHFGVAISMTNNTNASAFTTIQEWTMTAKSAQPYKKEINSTKDKAKKTPDKTSKNNHSGNREVGTWYQYTVDLSGYAGQSIWIAIRHFNCTDQYYINIDDITIFDGDTSPGGGGGGSGNITYQWTPGGYTTPDITVYPTETTTYTVTAYEDGISIGSAQYMIVVRPIPMINVTTSSGGTTICEGDEIQLIATSNVTPESFISPGDILCTDGSIVKPANWPCGKTAKGVVFYVDHTRLHGWAVSLNRQTSGNQTKFKWCNESNPTDIPSLPNYNNWIDAINDFDGYHNTMTIRSYGNSSDFPAAWIVDFDQGWYLPAIGQLNVLFSNILIVNQTLSLPGLGGEPITTSNNTEENLHLWSSTESSNAQESMFVVCGKSSAGSIRFGSKKTGRRVRQVIDF